MYVLVVPGASTCFQADFWIWSYSNLLQPHCCQQIKTFESLKIIYGGNFREKFQRTCNELSEFSPSPSKLVVLFFLVSYSR